MILLQLKINNRRYFFCLENDQNYCNSNPHLSWKHSSCEQTPCIVYFNSKIMSRRNKYFWLCPQYREASCSIWIKLFTTKRQEFTYISSLRTSHYRVSTFIFSADYYQDDFLIICLTKTELKRSLCLSDPASALCWVLTTWDSSSHQDICN